MAIQAYFLPAIYDLRVFPGRHRPGVGFSESATRFISEEEREQEEEEGVGSKYEYVQCAVSQAVWCIF